MATWKQTLRPSLMSATYEHGHFEGNGSDGYALAPSDSTVEYMAMFDAIWSRVGGKSWVKRVTNVKTHPNDVSRIIHNRMAVDPINPKHVIYASMRDGVLRSVDGATFTKVSVPEPVHASWPTGGSIGVFSGDGAWSVNGTQYGGYGSSCVVFDRSSAATSGRSSRAAVAVQGRGVYETSDGGATWAQKGSQPWQGMSPTSLSYGKDGELYVATPMQRYGLAVNATAGTYKIVINGTSTSAIAWNASAADIGNAISAAVPGVGVDQWAGNQFTAYIQSMLKTGGISTITVDAAGLTGTATVKDISNAYLGANRLWKVVGSTWTDITPDDWYNGIVVAADPKTSGRVVIMQSDAFNNARMFQMSTDGGASWNTVTRTAADGDAPWLTKLFTDTPNMWMSIDVPAWDMSQPDRLWVPEGVGVWRVDISGNTSTWRPYVDGLENLVITDVSVNPHAVMLAGWDRKLWRITDSSTAPTSYLPDPSFGSAWSVSTSPISPNVVVASLANHQNGNDVANSGYSTDYGATWTKFPTIPKSSTNASTFGYGQVVAKSATEFLWVSANSHGVYYTKNAGATWTAITLPGGVDASLANTKPHYIYRRVATVDSSGTYFLYVMEKGVFKSVDGGVTWTSVCADSALPASDLWWNTHLKAVSNKTQYVAPSGELFMSGGVTEASSTTLNKTNKFLRSVDGGVTWTTVPGMTSVSAFGFGMPINGSSDYTIMAHGYLNGVPCVAYSTDRGATWVKVAQFGGDTYANVVEIDGDWNTPGLFYLATLGMGALKVQIDFVKSTFAESITYTDRSHASVDGGTWVIPSTITDGTVTITERAGF